MNDSYRKRYSTLIMSYPKYSFDYLQMLLKIIVSSGAPYSIPDTFPILINTPNHLTNTKSYSFLHNLRTVCVQNLIQWPYNYVFCRCRFESLFFHLFSLSHSLTRCLRCPTPKLELTNDQSQQID